MQRRIWTDPGSLVPGPIPMLSMRTSVLLLSVAVQFPGVVSLGPAPGLEYAEYAGLLLEGGGASSSPYVPPADTSREESPIVFINQATASGARKLGEVINRIYRCHTELRYSSSIYIICNNSCELHHVRVGVVVGAPSSYLCG